MKRAKCSCREEEWKEPLREMTYMQKAPDRGQLELALQPGVTFWQLQIERAQKSPQASVPDLIMSCC